MHRSEPSRLQSLSIQLADKVNNFLDSNERIFEMKQGNQLLNIDILSMSQYFFSIWTTSRKAFMFLCLAMKDLFV